MKTNENQGFLTTPDTMGRSVPVKTPVRFKIVNEINGLVHISYGTALNTMFDGETPSQINFQ
jgi:hypothetical protein